MVCFIKKINFYNMKKLEMNEMEIVEGGKFWGWSEWTAMGPCTNGKMSVVRHLDTFWITVAYDYDVIDC